MKPLRRSALQRSTPTRSLRLASPLRGTQLSPPHGKERGPSALLSALSTAVVHAFRVRGVSPFAQGGTEMPGTLNRPQVRLAASYRDSTPAHRCSAGEPSLLNSYVAELAN